MTDDKHVEAIDQAYDRWLATDASAVHFTDCHGFGRRVWHAAFRAAPSATEPPHELQNRCLEHAALIAEDYPDIAQRIRALKISEAVNVATHWDECWRKHHGCAVAKIERLSAVTEIGTRHPDAYIEHHKGGNNLVWEETNLPCTPLYKSAPAEADADQAKDAARYRWLRDEGNNDWPSLVSAGISPPRIDAAIDAAMRETDGTHGE